MKAVLILSTVGLIAIFVLLQFDHYLKRADDDYSQCTSIPLKEYVESIFEKGHFYFLENKLTPCALEDIQDYVLVYKPVHKHFLIARYFQTGRSVKYSSNSTEVVNLIYEYLDANNLYNHVALTLRAATIFYPKYFNMPLKKIFLDSDNLNKSVPVFFLIPFIPSDLILRTHRVYRLSFVRFYITNNNSSTKYHVIDIRKKK